MYVSTWLSLHTPKHLLARLLILPRRSLYGITTLQTFIYFQKYQSDTRFLKFFVRRGCLSHDTRTR